MSAALRSWGPRPLSLNGSRDAANALLDGGKSDHLFAPPYVPQNSSGWCPFTNRRRRPSSANRPMSKSILIKTRRRTPTGRQMFSRPRAPAETGQGFLLFLRSECWSGGKICFPQLRVALVSAGCVIVFLSGCATPYATIGGSLEIQLALDSYRIGDACEGLCRLMVSRPMERCSNRESAHSATMASCRRS